MTTIQRSRAAVPRRRTGLIAEALSRPTADYYFVLVPTILLLGIGQLMVLSSSSLYSQSLNNNPYSIALKQALFLVAGIPVAAWLSRQGDRTLHTLSWVGMVVALLMLLLVLTPLGTDTKGNRAWLSLGPVSLQPSEFAKLALILFLAQIVSTKERVLDRPKEWGPAFIGFFAVVVLVLAEKDVGTALIICAIFAIVLWVSGLNIKLLIAVVLAAAVGMVALVATNANRMARIASFTGQDGSQDAYASQQPLSSVYALASGGWWGLGLGASRQKWGALADGAQNDFVLAVLGEELGLVGVASLLVLFGALCLAGFRIASRAPNTFRRVLAAGCTGWILVQALVNMAVAMRALPVVGVPLPFVSAGGSALLACMLAMGVLLSCARAEPDAVRAREAAARRARPKMSAVVESR